MAPWVVATVALSGALVLATLPKAPYAFSTYDYAIYNNHATGGEYISLSKRIGRDSPVIYLTFGSVNYLMGNPTSCRYPSPQWLQRGANIPVVRTFPSYQDNLKCLTGDQGEAKYLVWQPAWFSVRKSTTEVQSLIDAKFDCSPAARVRSPKALIVCPARGLTTTK